MADEQESQDQSPPQADAEAPKAPADEAKLAGGTYEIIRNRLNQHAGVLRERIDQLNAARKEVFGSIETKLLASERIATDNNCSPRDMVSLGDRFIFGYNVFIGLRSQTVLEDVFAVYRWTDGQFVSEPPDLIDDERFKADFANLYKYYRSTVFAKFAVIGPHLFMVFRTSDDPKDVKTFKWLIREGSLEYLDNRSDHEYRFPSQHEFEWRRVTQDMHRSGRSPHISIEDRVFVETLHGDLTVKIEDNTATGEGIYSEPVENPDQMLTDATIYYASVGNIILLKVRPYQEQAYRYLVYNEKVQQVVRIDSIADACVLLPEGHGLIFPKGYYLQTGETKLFESKMDDMVFDKRVSSPNGEDHLFVFYNRHSGTYVLLSYNVISQEVATPVICNGYSFFDDGTMLYFRDTGEATKHHVIQVWQTPFCGPEYSLSVQTDNFLYKIGNKDIVRCMAECTELLILVGKEETYSNLYVDIARQSQDVHDGYFWVANPEAFNLAQPLGAIQQAAGAAIEEFEKVVRTRQNTAREVTRVCERVEEILAAVDYDSMTDINQYVKILADLRAVRGEVISCRELRYAATEQIDAVEAQVVEHTEDLSNRCVAFLLEPESLQPYHDRVAAQDEGIGKVTRVVEAKELGEDVAQTGRELEMLTEIVSNLKIEDATQTTAIIDSISLVFQRLNQVKSTLKNRTNDLGRTEGQAEFTAQMKLVDQAVANYLDVCDTPEKCDEYLTRLMVQMESLEAKFSDFDEFIVQLADKREELYSAFETRKAQLAEARNRRASALMAASQRVLKGIRNRAEAMEDVNAINGYFASDRMIERLCETIDELESLGDTVKAEDVRSQLKSIQQDAIRQLKDRLGLYEDGQNVIRFGTHRFSVNRQDLELTIVNREGDQFFHLTGTGFFSQITDEEFLATRDVWDIELLSESPDVYRGEYLACRMLSDLQNLPAAEIEALAAAPLKDLLPRVQEFMAPRYAEGYVKGVHDQDAARILLVLLKLSVSIGLLRYPADARALALVFAAACEKDPAFAQLAAEVAAMGQMRGLFDYHGQEASYIASIRSRIEAFVAETNLFAASAVAPAAEYLFYELAGAGPAAMSPEAALLRKRFDSHLKHKNYASTFESAVEALGEQTVARFTLICKWLRAFVADQNDPAERYVEEAAAILLDPKPKREKIPAETTVKITGMIGSHARITEATYELDYTDFSNRLADHARRVVPQFLDFQDRKTRLIEEYESELRLGEFKPRVLTTFVRNHLIDRVYLQLVGDNLAKQIGSAGDTKRTDRQGLLLLISPPGYGKTTLMEYIANRLGLIFMKINGPAIGNRVTSIDPAEASNAASREEVQKLNLAFEMGDNVMIYVDDIQHCNPEFLQKFISLCDAQRRVEGVFNGRTRTYDLRGKRVCVVMAGNPYTESGEKFKIPDMLANRADTYNIGDIVGDNYDDFIDSYVENCLTSNPVLGKLATRSQADVYAVMKLAQGQPADSVQFEGNYGADELNEYVATMKKLFVVREVVLKVNQQYIASAGQQDEYRTEPPFLLQGSYRNMNRIASRVLGMMNDDELWTLILSAYEQDSQTLTTGAESNLLKFKELVDRMSPDELERWEAIKATYGRNKLMGGGEDQITQVIRQINALGAGVDGIRDVIAQATGGDSGKKTKSPAQQAAEAQQEMTRTVDEKFSQVNEALATIGEALQGGLAKRDTPADSSKQQAIVHQAAEALGQKLDGITTSLNKAADQLAQRPTDEMGEATQAILDRLNDVVLAVREDSTLQYETAKRHEALTINDNAQSMAAMLEEQFNTIEMWMRPVARDPAGRQAYFKDLIGRFQGMVDGYNRLIDVLEKQAKGSKAEEPAQRPTTPPKKPPPKKS